MQRANACRKRSNSSAGWRSDLTQRFGNAAVKDHSKVSRGLLVNAAAAFSTLQIQLPLDDASTTGLAGDVRNVTILRGANGWIDASALANWLPEGEHRCLLSINGLPAILHWMSHELVGCLSDRFLKSSLFVNRLPAVAEGHNFDLSSEPGKAVVNFFKCFLRPVSGGEKMWTVFCQLQKQPRQAFVKLCRMLNGIVSGETVDKDFCGGVLGTKDWKPVEGTVGTEPDPPQTEGNQLLQSVVFPPLEADGCPQEAPEAIMEVLNEFWGYVWDCQRATNGSSSTQDLVSLTQSPVSLTQSLVSLTQSPVSLTQSPVSLTQSPVSSTEGPLSLIQNTVSSLTQNPVFFNQDAGSLSENSVFSGIDWRLVLGMTLFGLLISWAFWLTRRRPASTFIPTTVQVTASDFLEMVELTSGGALGNSKPEKEQTGAQQKHGYFRFEERDTSSTDMD